SVRRAHLGVLALRISGLRLYLDMLGLALGPNPGGRPDHGSCITVCATDAPCTAQQLRRLALRPLLGLARVGSYGADGSGEIGVAFTTSTDGSLANAELDRYFAAAFEAAHEAVYNCLLAARPA